MKINPIQATIDFNQQGIQHGFLRLPHSSNESAWGSIMIPIMQIKNGTGPTALITGGNHGDEFEGPIALFDFATRTTFDDINGRVIVIPAMNYPAFLAGARVSPIDRVNLNRTFPGKSDGTVTEVIADYFSNFLLPMADVVLDIHSGGKTLVFLPFAASHRLEDADLSQKIEAAMHAFGAPYTVKMLEMDPAGLYDTKVESMKKIFVTTELGGAGTTSTETVEIAKRGVHNFLVHNKILDADIIPPKEKPLALDMPDGDSYILSEHAGLLEPCVDLGYDVKKGDLVARVYDVERTAVPPIEYMAKRDGIVIARSVSSLVKMGDTILVIAEVIA